MAATFKGKEAEGNVLRPGVIYDTSNTIVDGTVVNRRVFGMMADNGVFVIQGQDDVSGAVTWGVASAVASQTYDGTNKVPFETLPDLAVVNYATLPGGAPNPNYGNLYATWTRTYPVGQFPGRPELNGGSDVDTFWLDSESTEKIPDYQLSEMKTYHRVAGFDNLRVNGQDMGAPSRDLQGQNLPDPLTTEENTTRLPWPWARSRFAAWVRTQTWAT